jgi:hypothetical protein
VRQFNSVDGSLHTLYDIKKTGNDQNFTRSYYMNGTDFIVSGSTEETVVRVSNNTKLDLLEIYWIFHSFFVVPSADGATKKLWKLQYNLYDVM